MEIYNYKFYSKIVNPLNKTFEESKFQKIEVENKKIGENEYIFIIKDRTNYENYKYCSSSFIKFFNDEVRKNFDFLKIKYTKEKIMILNKEEILNKIENLTFEYFTKYIKKAKEVNLILKGIKDGLKYENFEQEIEEESILMYLFKVFEIKNRKNETVNSETLEIYSGLHFPTEISYKIEKLSRTKKKIFFKEGLNEKISPNSVIKNNFRQVLELPETEPFEFNFIIKGYYIYNTETETVEKIEVDKEIKFYNVTTSTKRVLELEGFDENEKDEGKTYDEAVGELFEYLDKIGRKKEIDRQEFENFVDGIAFSEKPKIFETLKWYIETNKIGFLELLEGERDRIYISKEDVLKVLEEIFGEL